jgi:D-xylose transport system ATP-binding protein
MAMTQHARAGRQRARVLTMRGIGKRFGAVKALTDVDFWVNEGEVVALIGDNGAGKSTLVKVLAGVHPPDAGTIDFDGEDVRIDSPADAQRLGIETIFQDLALCDNLDVVANLWLGRELREGGRLDEVEMEQRTWTLLRELSAKIPSVRVPVASLSGGQRQTVAIARSLIGEPRIVILDEPTAALGVAQTAEVLNLIERLRERGHGVILISHNMADVMAVADRAVVLRLGRNNGVYNIADITSETLIAAITGAADGFGRAGRPADTDRAEATAAVPPEADAPARGEADGADGAGGTVIPLRHRGARPGPREEGRR